MTRANYLTVSQTDLLNDWGRALCAMFGEPGYHVGSSLVRADWRDVDVRHILDDDAFRQLEAVVNIDRLNLAVSLWGRHVTGLPIDWQPQQRSAANAEFGEHRRNAIGISQRGWGGLAAHPSTPETRREPMADANCEFEHPHPNHPCGTWNDPLDGVQRLRPLLNTRVDIVERLRTRNDPLLGEAADLIEKYREHNEAKGRP